ncbi:LemA family protein [Acholeplasma granularum]|uniref:LemA family protein n=1 Tax=Acholeplasma granularum TaxID=264635 RepID=UPI000470A088|nr:LemA family protein [Acholeplasma granularum]
MKKLYVGLGVFIVLVIFVSVLWISAYNGLIRKENDLIEKRGTVLAVLSSRYEKMGMMIDAIEGANQTVQGYLDTIISARIAFANALAENDQNTIDETIETIDQTFITLMSYMEDNPSSYNTVNLYQNAISEFNASTNMVLNSIVVFNTSVTSYNNHIKTFPNNIFVGNQTKMVPYEVSHYNTPLPTFN